jgi:cholesterol transport system auxiliary component
MKPVLRMMTAGVLAAALAGCSIGGLLGGGKAPTVLQTLTPEAPDPGPVTRTAAAGQSVTVAVPLTSKELHTVRVPVQISPGNVQYVTNLTWIDTPDRLFQGLVAETIRRTTNRVESRRFVATAPADGTASTVGPALNRAANQVAREVAGWVGNSG